MQITALHEHRNSMEQAVLQQRDEVKRLEDQLRSTEFVVAQLSRRLMSNNNNGSGKEDYESKVHQDENVNHNSQHRQSSSSDPARSGRPAFSGFSSPDILKRVYKNNTGIVHIESTAGGLGIIKSTLNIIN